LREIGEDAGLPTYLIEQASAVDVAWIADVHAVGITAAASAPEPLVQEVIETLKAYRCVAVETLDGVEETVRFRLPQRLAGPRPAPALAEH
jgi:4-hydroxy-3-methylbut-2-enyl diphosphate reductase